jgi:phosphate uptake regulator
MKRRLVSQGRATLTVSLPSKWIKTFGLKAGDELDISEEAGKLILGTTGEVALEKTTIDLKDVGRELLRKYLPAAYKLGYDEITVLAEGSAQIEEVQKAIQRSLLGFEIVNQSRTSCTIKCIGGPLEDEFESILRRIFLMLKSMSAEAYDAIKAKEFDQLNSIKSGEQINNRLTTICRRIVNKKGYTKHSTYLYGLVNELEKVADEYKEMFKYVAEHKVTVSPELLKILSKVNQLYVDMYELFYKYDKKKAISINKDKKKIFREIDELFMKKKDGKFLHHSMSVVERLGNILSYIIGLKL